MVSLYIVHRDQFLGYQLAVSNQYDQKNHLDHESIDAKPNRNPIGISTVKEGSHRQVERIGQQADQGQGKICSFSFSAYKVLCH